MIDAPLTTEWPAAVALADGTVIIAELNGTGNARQASLRRLLPNASFDATFGPGRAFAAGQMNTITDIAADFNGRVIVAGTDSAGGVVKRFKLAADVFLQTAQAVEFYNDILDHYFLTADLAEVAAIRAGKAGPGWFQINGGFPVYTQATGFPSGALPVCRFYGNTAVNPATGVPFGPNSHVYILDGPECEAVKRDRGWVFESFAFYMFPSFSFQCAIGQVPVFRVYNGRAVQNDSNHRFTTSQTVYQQMLNAGWRGEGIVMCAPLP